MGCPHGNVPETCSWCMSSEEALAQIQRENAEIIRVNRWHATYNAALSGLLARMPSPSPGAMEPALNVVMGNAEWITDRKHGPLKP